MVDEWFKTKMIKKLYLYGITNVRVGIPRMMTWHLIGGFKRRSGRRMKPPNGLWLLGNGSAVWFYG